MGAAVKATRTVLSKYATFSGRATASEFWWWVLSLIVIIMIIRLIDGTLIAPLLGFEKFQPEGGQLLSMILLLALTIPTIAVSVRRLHDSGKSGWLLLINFLPLIGGLLLIYFFIQPSEGSDNKYGPVARTDAS